MKDVGKLDIAQKVAKALDFPQSFEEVAPGRGQRLVSGFAKAFESLLVVAEDLGSEVIMKERLPERPDHIDLAWLLLWQAGNTFIASAHLLGRGYPTECLALARLATEHLACAVVIRDNPQLARPFRKGRLTRFGPEAVSKLSETVGGFGELYGKLSALGAHTHCLVPQLAAVAYQESDGERDIIPSIGGDYRTEGERTAWAELADYLCNVCEQLLAPAPRQVFFNRRRRRTKMTRVNMRPGDEAAEQLVRMRGAGQTERTP